MINKIDALTDSEFIELINSSSNTADVLKKLDYTVKGNSWAYNIIADRMDELKVCFLKKENNYSKYKEKLPLSDILTVNSGEFCKARSAESVLLWKWSVLGMKEVMILKCKRICISSQTITAFWPRTMTGQRKGIRKSRLRSKLHEVSTWDTRDR